MEEFIEEIYPWIVDTADSIIESLLSKEVLSEEMVSIWDYKEECSVLFAVLN